MTLACSIITLDWGTKGDVVGAIIMFLVGIVIDVMIVDELGKFITIKGGEE